MVKLEAQGLVDFDIMHDSWKPFFNDEIMDKLNEIESKIGDDYNPKPGQVLRFSAVNLHKLKVIILGQDPYPQKGVATGRSFEVGGLNSWLDTFRQTSLRNILRSLYKCRTGKLETLSEIREEISAGGFAILPPCKIFDYWEEQGVLMLNTFLTCKTGKPGSHKKLWAPVTDRLIKYISDNNNSAVWFLWGSQARAYAGIIGDRKLYMSNHPMIANPKNPEDFLNNLCFEETSKALGIDWIGNHQ